MNEKGWSLFSFYQKGVDEFDWLGSYFLKTLVTAVPESEVMTSKY